MSKKILMFTNFQCVIATNVGASRYKDIFFILNVTAENKPVTQLVEFSPFSCDKTYLIGTNHILNISTPIDELCKLHDKAIEEMQRVRITAKTGLILPDQKRVMSLKA